MRHDVAFERMRSVSVASPAQPDVEIVLEPPVADPHASDADKEAAAELLAKGLLRGVIFRTDDVDAAFERIRAAGAEVVQEPMDMPYGVRDCAFRDPAGNMLRFSQAPRSEHHRRLDLALGDVPVGRSSLRLILGRDLHEAVAAVEGDRPPAAAQVPTSMGRVGVRISRRAAHRRYRRWLLGARKRGESDRRRTGWMPMTPTSSPRLVAPEVDARGDLVVELVAGM